MIAGESVRKAPSTAQRRLAGAVTNEAAPLTHAAHYNTYNAIDWNDEWQHTGMPRRGLNDSEKKHVAYGLV